MLLDPVVVHVGVLQEVPAVPAVSYTATIPTPPDGLVIVVAAPVPPTNIVSAPEVLLELIPVAVAVVAEPVKYPPATASQPVLLAPLMTTVSGDELDIEAQ
jgi:hypothetical protein